MRCFACVRLRESQVCSRERVVRIAQICVTVLLGEILETSYAWANCVN